MSLYEEIWHHDNNVKVNYIASSLSEPYHRHRRRHHHQYHLYWARLVFFL